MIMLSWFTKGRAYLGERLANRSPRTPPVSMPTALPTLKKMFIVAVSASEKPVICRQKHRDDVRTACQSGQPHHPNKKAHLILRLLHLGRY